MKLMESGENYLETILTLSGRLEHVRSIDVVNALGFSKPSVSRAVNLLKNDGYLSVDGKGYLTLTPAGMEIAAGVLERHQWLTEFFVSIGVAPEVAALDACRVEHVISGETFEKMKERLKQ